MAGETPLLLTFHAVCVLSFLAWLSIDRELKPSACAGYLSAVRFMLNRSNIDTQFMDDNQHINSTKTGMWIGSVPVYASRSGREDEAGHAGPYHGSVAEVLGREAKV
jgi:hypothetical protein